MLNRIELKPAELERILAGLKEVRVCVLGDVCLDMYWYADMKRSRLSRETPHHPLPIVKEHYFPGGCGNVLNNVHALGIKKLVPISVVGNDWRGFLLNRWLQERNIDTSEIFTGDRITPCYCKPMRMGISDVVYEDPRLDFENFEELGKEEEDRIIGALERAAGQVDIIAVSDQYRFGVVTPLVRKKLAELGMRGVMVVVDSREKVQEYHNVIVKPNGMEAAMAVGVDITDLEMGEEDYAEVAYKLFLRNKKPVVVTLGERGSIWYDEKGSCFAPTRKAAPPVDIVGAGDTFLSAFCCAIAAGADGGQALAFGNLAAGVTVKKIDTTGTASPTEIAEKYRENCQ